MKHVEVCGAPGYANFQGVELLEFHRKDGTILVVVQDCDEEIHVIRAKYVYPMAP